LKLDVVNVNKTLVHTITVNINNKGSRIGICENYFWVQDEKVNFLYLDHFFLIIYNTSSFLGILWYVSKSKLIPNMRQPHTYRHVCAEKKILLQINFVHLLQKYERKY
jgi:hypothetical protein